MSVTRILSLTRQIYNAVNMKKQSVLSYDEYVKRHPKSEMSAADYEKEYLQPQKDDYAEQAKLKPKTHKVTETPSIQPKPKKKVLPKINPVQADKHKSFQALLKFTQKGKVKTKEDASTLIRHLGYNEKEFVDYMIEGLGSTASFDDVRHFEQIGIVPKSYVSRAVMTHDKENSVPPKYHEEYFGKSASVSQEIKGLELKLKLAVSYEKYKKKHPKTKKTRSDYLFTDELHKDVHKPVHKLISQTSALKDHIHNPKYTMGGVTVHDNKGNPIGFASLHPTTWETGRIPSGTHAIVQMGVHPKHQGKGLGTKLMKKIKSKAEELGYKNLIGYTHHSPGFKTLSKKNKITNIDDVNWGVVAPQ